MDNPSHLPSYNGWEPFDFLYTQDAGVVYGAGTPPVSVPVEPHGSPDAEETPNVVQEQQQTKKLALIQQVDWDEEKTYDEDPPSCIHYSIEWKVTVNNKVFSKDTEQNLVLAPAVFWELVLQPKLEKLLRRKVPHNRCVRPDDTNIVVSVTERSERDLTKRFDDTDTDWSIVEKQLVHWGERFRAGKKLRVDITFGYIETGPEPSGSSKKIGKRGRSSATQQMLAERADFLNTDDESPEQSSVWRDVYNLMRCPGPPCHLGPHCWRDPVGKKAL